MVDGKSFLKIVLFLFGSLKYYTYICYMKLKQTEMIHLGATYEQKYLTPNNFKSEEIPAKNGYVKSYLITNRPDAPVYRGVLNILADGRAVIFVKYVSYSGVANKYENYFNNKGLEIVHKNNSTKEEKKFWLLMK